MISTFMEANPSSSEETSLLAALATLTPSQFSHFTHAATADISRHRLRLSAVLSCPAAFSHALRRLQSLSLQQKCLLLAKHLLSSLRHVTHFSAAPPIPTLFHLRLHDYDAVLVFLLLCELHPESLRTQPQHRWRAVAARHFLSTVLSGSGFGGVHGGSVLMEYVDTVARWSRLVGGGGGKSPAATEVVVELPSTEVMAVGEECVICKEEMKKGRDVCELPCLHSFHWMCILRWLGKTNTCPCCRLQLPSDDVFGEIRRLWGVVVKMGGGRSDAECKWSAP